MLCLAFGDFHLKQDKKNLNQNGDKSLKYAHIHDMTFLAPVLTSNPEI